MKKGLKRKSRKGSTDISLGTARTPKHEYVNTMARKAKMDRIAQLPYAGQGKSGRNIKRRFAVTMPEWKGLRAQLGQDQPLYSFMGFHI